MSLGLVVGIATPPDVDIQYWNGDKSPNQGDRSGFRSDVPALE